jgi:lauroyl/myristoyl acyltransferase
MGSLLYFLALGVVRAIQALPLPVAAWLGRRGGGLAYLLDGRHRRVALDNLTQAFQTEKSPAELRALAREHFRRLGQNYASAIKTASMKPAALARHVQVVGLRRIQPASESDLPPSRLFAIGHFGNFELYARIGQFVPGCKAVTTYRALPQPRLNELLLSLREESGCLFFERRTQSQELLHQFTQPGRLIGLLSDQHAGDHGLRLPFFGRDCSTLAAPAILAQRYKLPLHTGLCFSTGLARWRMEVGDEIPTFHDGQRRPIADIMRDVNLALEQAIRRDPANWFWVHRRWKPAKRREAKLKAES